MTFIASGPDKNVIAPLGGPSKRLGNVKPGTGTGEVVTYEQLQTNAINKTDSGNNTYSGNETFTGTNTHSGIETFSNATGVTTDIVSERTAGNGTAVKTPVRVVSGATLTSATTPAISAATSGTTYTFGAAAITVTLPACSATNIGLKYRFVTTTIATAQIINTTGTDVFLGGVFSTLSVVNATNDTFFGTSTANKTMTMNGTTTGGLPGSVITVECVSATQWLVTGFVVGASGTQATLFSN